MKKIYVSVASHDSEELILENFAHFSKEFDDVEIVVGIIDNTNSAILESFCKAQGFLYFHDGKIRGYGENHNKNFELLSPKDDELFLVCNPDIFISMEDFSGMVKSMYERDTDILNIKSYLDKNSGKLDYPDRYFPGILNFFISLLTGKRLHYGNNERVKHPEWMSGGFMLFRAEVFRKLGGFDEDYFMYCEDIDLCYRAKKMGLVLEYDDRFHNIHNSRMHSRKLFSKSMFWHLGSAFRFVIKNRFFTPVTFAR